MGRGREHSAWRFLRKRIGMMMGMDYELKWVYEVDGQSRIQKILASPNSSSSSSSSSSE